MTRTLTFTERGMPILGPQEMLVVETAAERLILQVDTEARVLSTRYPKPANGGRQMVLRPEDRIAAVTPRFGPLRVGEPMPYSVRGVSLSGRAVPRRSAPVLALRVATFALDEPQTDGDL